MKTCNCPSCGAEVEFKSAAAALAICSFCRATVLRDGQSAAAMGKLSEILDDFSPIQLGTQGAWKAKRFTVIGRLRLQYADGAWNEWAVEFQDGSSGWLSDASAQFVVTRRADKAQPPAPLEQLQAGRNISINNQKYLVSDARSCICVGGEGELPEPAHDGKEFRSVDLRAIGGSGFITFDYSDEPPSVYAGEACAGADLGLTNLRSQEQIEQATAKLKGGVSGFACPSCGASLEYHAGFGETVACSFCKAVVALEGERRSVVLKQDELAQRQPTIPLGTKGKLRGSSYEAIGFMARSDGEGEAWEEYLLFAPGAGFLWLTHAADDWYLGAVLNGLPEERGDKLYYAGKAYRKDAEYTATTTFVLGEFNWRVKLADAVAVSEWSAGDATLSRESYQEEVSWTLSAKLSQDTIAAAFGLPLAKANAAAPEATAEAIPWRWVLLAWGAAFLLDLSAQVVGKGDLAALLLAALVLWLPRRVFGGK